MNFKSLAPEDYFRYRHFFKNQKYQLCEYSLATLIIWGNDEYRPEAAVEGDTIFIRTRVTSRPDLAHLILPVSPSATYSPEDLAELAGAAGVRAFWFVPDCYLETFGRERIEKLFTIEVQTAYQDYVYLTDDLATLKGNRYAKKRNLISQFLRQYPDPEKRVFEPISKENADECRAFLEEWCKTRDCDQDLGDSLTCERLALEKFLANIDMFESPGLLLKLNGAPAAFGIMTRLTGDMGILQFEKAFEHIKGLYQYFDNEIVRRLFSSYRFVNKESAMDVPGLAKAKQSYHPVRLVTSHRLQLKNRVK